MNDTVDLYCCKSAFLALYINLEGHLFCPSCYEEYCCKDPKHTTEIDSSHRVTLFDEWYLRSCYFCKAQLYTIKPRKECPECINNNMIYINETIDMYSKFFS